MADSQREIGRIGKLVCMAIMLVVQARYRFTLPGTKKALVEFLNKNREQVAADMVDAIPDDVYIRSVRSIRRPY